MYSSSGLPRMTVGQDDAARPVAGLEQPTHPLEEQDLGCHLGLELGVAGTEPPGPSSNAHLGPRPVLPQDRSSESILILVPKGGLVATMSKCPPPAPGGRGVRVLKSSRSGQARTLHVRLPEDPALRVYLQQSRWVTPPWPSLFMTMFIRATRTRFGLMSSPIDVFGSQAQSMAELGEVSASGPFSRRRPHRCGSARPCS